MTNAPVRLKHRVTLVNEDPAAPARFVGLEHVESWTGKYTLSNDQDATARGFRSGDVMFGKLRPYLAKAFVADTSGACGSEFLVLRPGRQVYSRFLGYTVLEQGFIDAVNGSTFGAKMPRANWDFIGGVRIDFPPLPTQKAIADFLDKKTAAIDALIEKKQKLLVLLAEKRAALIAHLLEPLDGPHVRLARTVDLLPGYAFSSSDFLRGDEGVPLLRGINVGTGRLRWDDVVRWSSDLGSGVGRFLLQPGDIVLGMDRPWIGGGLRVATITQDDCPCLLLQRVARLRPKSSLRSAYLRLTLEWKRFRAHLEPELTGVSVPHLSGDQILSYRIPVPSLDIQDTILSRAMAIQTVDESIHKSLNCQVERLQEYRQALITAAVTGQLDIGEAA